MKNDYHPRKLSDFEIVDAFPDGAREHLPSEIRKCKRNIAKEKKKIINLISFVNNQDTDDFTKYFCKEVIKMECMSKLNKLNKALFHMENQWRLLNPNLEAKKTSISQQQIESAKEYPIFELARDALELQPSGRNYKALCIFHEEKHASLVLFTETNTYHCFSCGNGGDSINLYMALHQVSFKEAVHMLSKK